MSIAIYIAVMAGVTYLIRVIPFAFFRKQITSKFLNSLLYYIPYAVLSAMTFPAIFYTITASIGTAIALVLAYFDLPLIVVALSASLAAWISGLIIL